MKKNMLSRLRAALRAKGNPEKAKVLQRFFKTGKGEYAEGDIFIGLTVPECRAIAKEYSDLSSKDMEQLLHSKIHEERLVALLLLVQRFIRIDQNIDQEGIPHQKSRPRFLVRCDTDDVLAIYLRNTQYVNNWDLVDLSAPKILGAAIFRDRISKNVLTQLAKSKNVWERRIAIIATLYLIQHNQLSETLRLARILLHDPHDLIHKAVGWMLREVGKRDFKLEQEFVRKYAATMPRTMLRYAVERWPEKLRRGVMA